MKKLLIVILIINYVIDSVAQPDLPFSNDYILEIRDEENNLITPHDLTYSVAYYVQMPSIWYTNSGYTDTKIKFEDIEAPLYLNAISNLNGDTADIHPFYDVIRLENDNYKKAVINNQKKWLNSFNEIEKNDLIVKYTYRDINTRSNPITSKFPFQELNKDTSVFISYHCLYPIDCTPLLLSDFNKLNPIFEMATNFSNEGFVNEMNTLQFYQSRPHMPHRFFCINSGASYIRGIEITRLLISGEKETMLLDFPTYIEIDDYYLRIKFETGFFQLLPVKESENNKSNERISTDFEGMTLNILPYPYFGYCNNSEENNCCFKINTTGKGDNCLGGAFRNITPTIWQKSKTK